MRGHLNALGDGAFEKVKGGRQVARGFEFDRAVDPKGRIGAGALEVKNVERLRLFGRTQKSCGGGREGGHRRGGSAIGTGC